MARRYDWVPCSTYGEPTQNIAGGTPEDIVLVRPDVAAGNLGLVSVPDPVDDVTVIRVVGAVFWEQTGAPTFPVVIERIRMAVDVGGVQVQGAALDLQDADDANEPFLWQRVYASRNANYGASSDGATHPWWSHIDVTVKRRVNNGEALIYSIQFATPATGLVRPFLRTLVSKR